LGNLQNIDMFAVLVVSRCSWVCRRRFGTAHLSHLQGSRRPISRRWMSATFQDSMSVRLQESRRPKKGVVGWFVTDVSGHRMGPISRCRRRSGFVCMYVRTYVYVCTCISLISYASTRTEISVRASHTFDANFSDLLSHLNETPHFLLKVKQSRYRPGGAQKVPGS